MRYRLLFSLHVFIAVLFSQISYAAFPVHGEVVQPAAKQEIAAKEKIQQLVFKNNKLAKIAAKTEEGTTGSGFGVAAFGLGLGSTLMLLMALVVPPAAGLLLGLAILGSIAAIVLGAIGMNKPRSGLAVAGFVLGIINLSLLLIILALIVLFLSLIF